MQGTALMLIDKEEMQAYSFNPGPNNKTNMPLERILWFTQYFNMDHLTYCHE